MSSRKTKNRPRTGAPGRRLLVVNSAEVGVAYGCLTLRSGGHRPKEQPCLVALPCEVLPGLFQNLSQAVPDAEEDYWGAVQHAVASARGDDSPEAVALHMERLLKRQDWNQVLARLPCSDRGEHPLGLITYTGHVGLYVGPPMTHRSLLAIYDPLQLKRLEPKLRQAGAQAHHQQLQLPAHPLQRMQQALDFLGRQPWPPSGFTPPTARQAEDYMRDQRIAFLAGTPYQRPAGQDLASRAAAENDW